MGFLPATIIRFGCAWPERFFLIFTQKEKPA
jgi:hypothetical protein